MLHDNSNVSHLTELEKIRKAILNARRVLIITGAGVSADSGLPTYRGLEGLYNGKTEDGLWIEEALSARTMIDNPKLCWKYLANIGTLAANAEPNVSHKAIAAFQKASPGRWLLTQNIDELHRRAGSPDEQSIEIHGRMHPLYCLACDYTTDVTPSLNEADLPPVCPECSGIMRPSVVLFDEMLPVDAEKAFIEENQAEFDVVLVVGTTGLFPYIAGAIQHCKHIGGYVVEINPSDTVLTQYADVLIESKAKNILPYLLGYSSEYLHG